ncbi:relaxase/mobilization nuclease domain-containing protein [Streptococcus intermedius]|uniref:relaxase/mobilization nuclease domain-containing protein n=1 Tax=Streptococcus intermedius TaxID=1338 RepID=UPI002000ED90|nr:relaxase/mobilization nuclease domain-containing protein [Streptococcus intermedius]
MAVTKIHPIEKTLYLALDYIMNEDKTDEKILISSFACNPKTAHLEFEQTKRECNSKAKILARHLIQAFAPGETTPEQAHQIGLDLCDRVLQGKYEYVLTTHIDKGHLHNHILFNNVSFETGKAYQSNKRSYHQIRTVSDDLCRENGLSVIDENYKRFKNRYSTNGKSYMEYTEFKRGNSWKNKLQLAIDKAVLKSKTYEEFLKTMEDFGYEIKIGKYLSFRHKDKRDKGRFTRAKASTLGEDYTKERIKERIKDPNKHHIYANQEYHYEKLSYKKPDTIVDMKNNEKVKSSKGYEVWAGKHNMRTMASALNEIRKSGISSYEELDLKLKKVASDRQQLLDKIKHIEKEMKSIYSVIENKNTISENQLIYDMYMKDKENKAFYEEYKPQIIAYETAMKSLKNSKYQSLNIQDLSDKYMILEQEKTTLMGEYSSQNSMLHKLQQAKKNTDLYLDNHLEK